MASFNTTEWVIVALVFIAGWLLGLASHTGGRKWRDRYATERDAHAAYRTDAEARIAAAEARHRELDAERARVVTAPPVTAATPVQASQAAPVTTTTHGATTVREGARPVETVVIRPGEGSTDRRL